MAKHERTYEGRALPRPDDELVDQGLGFDLGTVVDRRRLLQMFDGVKQLGTVNGDVTRGLRVSLAVPADTKTTPSGGGMPGGGPGGTPPSGAPGGGMPPS